MVDDRDLLAELLDLVELVAARRARSTRPGPDRLAPGRWRRYPWGRALTAARPARAARGCAQAPPSAGPAAGSHGTASPLWSSCDRQCRAVPATSRWHTAAAAAEPVQPAQVLKLLADEHAWVQPALFGHVTEATALSLAHRGAVPPDASGVQIGETEDGPHCRRLSRAVGRGNRRPARRAPRKKGRRGRSGPVRPAQSLQLQQPAHPARLLCRGLLLSGWSRAHGSVGLGAGQRLRLGSVGAAAQGARAPVEHRHAQLSGSRQVYLVVTHISRGPSGPSGPRVTSARLHSSCAILKGRLQWLCALPMTLMVLGIWAGLGHCRAIPGRR